MSNGTSEKSGIACLLFLLLLQPFGLGVHRFYVGKMGTGLLYILTLGGFGIWWLIDLIMLISGSFTDSDGAVVKLGK